MKFVLIYSEIFILRKLKILIMEILFLFYEVVLLNYLVFMLSKKVLFLFNFQGGRKSRKNWKSGKS